MMSQTTTYATSGGGGSGTVTSIIFNGGLISTPDPVTTTGTATIDQTNLTFLDGTVYWDTGTQLLHTTSTGTSGQVLTSSGVGSPPSYQNPAASSITIAGDSGGGLTGNSFTFTGGATGLTFSGAGTTETLTGTLAISHGGTNATSFATTNGTVYFDGTRLVDTAVGTSGFVLTSNGAAAPTYQAIPAGGIITINGDIGSITGSTVTIKADVSTINSGSTVQFTNSGTVSTLNVTDSSGNTMIGKLAGNAAISGTNNVGLGYQAQGLLTSGSNNIGIGQGAGYFTTTSSNNIAIGTAALENFNTGGENVAIGVNSQQNSSGSRNVSVGTTSYTRGAGIGNCAIGYQSLRNVTGAANANSVMGNNAASAYTTNESNNIIINNDGVIGDSGFIRIGTNGTQTKCFVAGINGVTVTTPQLVTVNSSDQLGSQAPTGLTTTWSVITANQTAAVSNGYFINKAGTLALLLPATSAVGDVVEVVNINTTNGTQVTQAASQQIFIGSTSTTAGAGGSLTSTQVGDTLRLVCRTANLTWQVVNGLIGNWTVV